MRWISPRGSSNQFGPWMANHARNGVDRTGRGEQEQPQHGDRHRRGHRREVERRAEEALAPQRTLVHQEREQSATGRSAAARPGSRSTGCCGSRYRSRGRPGHGRRAPRRSSRHRRSSRRAAPGRTASVPVRHRHPDGHQHRQEQEDAEDQHRRADEEPTGAGLAVDAADRRRGRGVGADAAPAPRPRVLVMSADDGFEVGLGGVEDRLGILRLQAGQLAVELLDDVGSAGHRRQVLGVLGAVDERRHASGCRVL